ncbi:MAG: retinol dehydrogenase 12 [Actinomycetota bacterium]|jgi:NAD(P)-dependent dehydrogenase (short-subunit alcohol dehydrogenase family)
MPQTMLITGANTGIGKAAAEALAADGHRLYLACRSEDKTRPVIEEIATKTGNHELRFLPLDLTSLASVRACAAAFLETGDPLHVLMNNAGVAGQQGFTEDGFELTFGVNHLGHFLLTTLLLEQLQQSAPARIVNVSSIAHTQAKGIDWEAVRKPTKGVTALHEYAVSKFANVLFTQELARRLHDTGVTAYAVHPGGIGSDIWSRRLPSFMRGPVNAVIGLAMKSTAEGAKTQVWCATAPELATESGRYYDDRKEKPANAAATPELAAELWARSEEWTTA